MKLSFLCLYALITFTLPGKAQTSGDAAFYAQVPGYYRLKSGSYEITALSDGTMLMPVDKLLQGARPGEVAAAYKHQYESLPAETSMNCFLISTGSKLILVDAGGGDVYRQAGLGKLISNLNAAGYKPGQIDAILLTHCHADHTGGLLYNGKIAFPNATIYMHQADYDLLFNASGEPFRKYLANEVAVMTPYKNAGKIKTFSTRADLFAGITAIPAPGHTPGHTFFQIISGEHKLLLWGDVVHAAEAQFPNPELSIQFDFDGNAARLQRKKIFAEAAKEGYLIGAAHISFPGFGHVGLDSAKYSWIPVSYSNGNTAVIFK